MNCKLTLASSPWIVTSVSLNLKHIKGQSRAEAMEKGSQWQSAVELVSLSGQLATAPNCPIPVELPRSLWVSLAAVSLNLRALERRRREH